MHCDQELAASGLRLAARTTSPSTSAASCQLPAASHRRGVVIVYASVFMVALMAMVSLAVDWGRVQTAKTELQDATDAAARYAVAGLYDSSYVAKAQAAGVQNTVDGNLLSIASADITSGNWNTTSRVFVANGTPANAVRVIGRRTSATGTAVPLIFGRAIGLNSVDVKSTSICRQSSLAAVGINSLTLSAYGTVQRKSGEGGGVSVASNGLYTTGTFTSISGDVFYRTLPVLLGTIGGRVEYLPNDFVYATPTLPGSYTNYGASPITVSSGSQPVSGNIYIGGDVNINGTANVALYGDTYLYCGGNVYFSGACTVTTNGYRLFIYSVGTGTISCTNSNPLPLIIYAPTSPVMLTGTGAINGSVVGKTLTISTTLNYTGTSAIPFKPTGGGDLMQAGGVITSK